MRELRSSAEECFAYWGEREGWLSVIGRHRDSCILDVSNFETVRADLEERFGDFVAVESFSNFLVGWTEVLLVDPANPDAVQAAEAWRDALEDYPVADEEDYSRREYEDALETLENCYGVSSDHSCEVYAYCFREWSHCRGEDFTGDDVDAAMVALGIKDEED